ncbi:MAG: hypothetical protein QY331_07555 [Melioribacteraceae bacterium]|nr:MAG: hypothetical protein QY331_07555 [Melioribacteraceae bacterium]
MKNSKSYQQQLLDILKEKNISLNVVANLAGKSRQSVRGMFNTNLSNMREDTFLFYKNIIDSVDTDNYYEKYVRGPVSVKKIPQKGTCKNKILINQFLTTHGINKAFAARICNLTPSYFNAKTSLSNHYKLDDKKATEIISKLEEYVNSEDKYNL